jgi:hypothetical protein
MHRRSYEDALAECGVLAVLDPFDPRVAPSSTVTLAKLPGGEPRKASQRTQRRAASSPARISPTCRAGDAVRWRQVVVVDHAMPLLRAEQGRDHGRSTVGIGSLVALRGTACLVEALTRCTVLTPPTQVSDVTTSPGDQFRADEPAYDPQHGTLLVINNADDPPFGTLISVNKTTGSSRSVRGSPFTDATNGAEQPVWDPDRNRFYLSVPQLGPRPRRTR